VAYFGQYPIESQNISRTMDKPRSTSDRPMSANPKPKPEPLEAAVDHAIAACGGDMRATIEALIVANQFLEAAVSHGYVRGTDRKIATTESYGSLGTH
jgi:hypothetical protein